MFKYWENMLRRQKVKAKSRSKYRQNVLHRQKVKAMTNASMMEALSI